MIGIGAVYGGPEASDSRIYDIINSITKVASNLTESFKFGSAPAINIVFHVPGSLSKNEFEGIRDAKFSRKDKLLMVQISVPEEKLDAEDLLDFLILSMHQANAVAFHFFTDRGIDFPLAQAEELVKQVGKIVKKDSQ